MENVKIFFQFLRKFINMNDEELNLYFGPYIQIRQFQKKQIITPLHEVENYFNFISKGLIRKYFLKENEEINVQISTEGQLIHAHESFHSRQPSEYIVEAIESSILLSISYQDLEKIFSTNARLERMGRMIVTFTMMMKDKWQMNLIKLSPRERYLNLVKKNPELLKRVPQKYLASYLNIQPETFSRFKHLLKLSL